MTLDPVEQDVALGALLAVADEPGLPLLDRVIAAARAHLDADVAFLCEFVDGDKVIRRAAGGIHGRPLAAGDHFSLPDTYCYRMVCGRLPNLIVDARHDERVRDLPITRELDIGSYVAVPVRLPGGGIYGTLCCISHEVDPTIHERDIKFMRVLADLLGAELAQLERHSADRAHRTGRIEDLVRSGPTVLFQSIVDLEDGRVVGMEALSRFAATPLRPPDRWFSEAWSVGLGVELEMAAVHEALRQRCRLPDGAYLSINASPLAVQSPRLLELLRGHHSDGLLVEVTEHVPVESYEHLLDAISRLRAIGVKLAVDDFGAGYSSLNHALRVRPNLVKLDMQLTHDIDTDLVRQALVEATVGFAARTGVNIVAEGVETEGEAHMLRSLGVRFGQGYHFGRPQPLPAP